MMVNVNATDISESDLAYSNIYIYNLLRFSNPVLRYIFEKNLKYSHMLIETLLAIAKINNPNVSR